MNIKVLSDPTRREHVLEKIPVRRIGTPQDIAGAAVFLASPEAAYINGATLYVDGGILTH
jgi:3-oxoacyl-[acyl-carrier protein] reductase